MSHATPAIRSAQRGAVTLIAVILLITVITFSALVTALYTNSNVSDTLHQDDGIAALFLAESGLEAALYNLSVSNTCDNTGVGAGATLYALGRGSFEIVSGDDTLTAPLCRITARGTIGSVARTVEADVRLGGGAITFVAGTSIGVNSNSIALTVPAGIVAGDVLLAQISVRGGSGQTIAPQVGGTWTQIGGQVNNGATLAQAVFYRIATAAEPASYTWTFSSARAAGAMLAYRGVNTTTPIDVSGAQTTSPANANVTAPSVTTTVANTRLIGLFGTAHGNVNLLSEWTTPAGMIARVAVGAGGGPNGASIFVADEARGPVGATGARMATATDAGLNIGHAVALQPSGTTLVVTWREP